MPSAPRSFWKGHLRLALVTIPIRIVSATASEDKIALHQVDRKSKQRIRYHKVAGETGKVVPQEDIVSGFQNADGTYVLFEKDELDSLKLSTRHTLELTQFVDACSIDPLYFDNPYYILPDGDIAEEGYRVIRDALRAASKVGVGQLTMRGRENLVALKACGDGLLLETLRYEDEVRDADDVFSSISSGKLRPELIAMARQLIEERTKTFDAGAFKNHYAEALRDFVKAKVKGGETVDVSGGDDRPAGGTVIDFMEALRQSTANDQGRPKSPGSKKAAPASAAQSRRPKAAARAKPKSRARKSA